MKKQDFLDEIENVIRNKPDNFREGQAVFNYIDEKYHIAREIQFRKGVDCFYNDKNIKSFINEAYNLLCKHNVNDFPGDNMIEE